MQARSLALILAALMTIGSLAGCVEPESEGHTHEEGDHDHDEGEDPVDDGTEDGGEGEHSDEGEHDDEGETETIITVSTRPSPNPLHGSATRAAWADTTWILHTQA